MSSLLPPSNSHLLTGNLPGVIRVLVVDDEPAVLFAYRKLIEKEGMTVDISANLEDAVRNVRRYDYLAVIADLRLAGIDNSDGLEILRVVQNECPGTKTILTTGYGSNDIEKTARNLGVSHYFKKPVQPSDILRVLREFHTGAFCPPSTKPA